MPRVLVISYPWLPGFSGGVKLVASLSRYLPEAGWDPTILARDWTEGAAPEDAELGLTFELGDLPPSLRAAQALPVVRARYAPRENTATRLRDSLATSEGAAPPARGRRLAKGVLEAAYPLYGDYPDAFRGWEEHAVAAGIAAVRQYGIGAVVSVSSPATAHIVGGEIARQADLPWVPLFGRLESFRLDAGDGRTARRRMEHRLLARRWLRGASRIAAVSPEMAAHLQEVYGVEADTVIAGFDPEERRMPPRRVAGAPLRIVHLGRLGEQLPGIDMLASALERLLDDGTLTDDGARVELVGTGRDDALRALLAGRRAAPLFHLCERVPPADALRMQRDADLLLMLDGSGGDPLQPYPVTLLEQVGARRPTVHVAAGAESFIARLLTETRAGTSASTTEELSQLLLQALEQLRTLGEVPFAGEEAAIARYSAVEQARRLAGLLDSASVGRFGSWQRM